MKKNKRFELVFNPDQYRQVKEIEERTGNNLSTIIKKNLLNTYIDLLINDMTKTKENG